MEADNGLPKEASRISRKPERPYVSSLKSYSRRSAMEARRRPLRTYSKRVSPIESAEPVPKRQRITAVSSAVSRSMTAPLCPSEPESSCNAEHSLLVIPPLPQPPKKGTITAYFKKALPEPSYITSSSEPSSDPAEPSMTPPSSLPIVTMRRRRARRLTTRIGTQHTYEDQAYDEDEVDYSSKECMRGTGIVESPAYARPSVLSEIKSNTLNQAETTLTTQSKGSKRRRNASRDHNRASVQTTLSLSITEKGYTECKECGMLYNPVHEADVRFHARRHAALRRAKERDGGKSSKVKE
ncbi:hypothetical protein F5Y19DRAFT_153821 [Xylariaceae sp. FL1651]|nr:hypothetical protein F5Y19DRAFT_153821 [Xylariaceae sp. FL1651]